MKTKILNYSIFSLLMTLFITACATHLDTISPTGTNLSGRWLLNESASQPVIISARGTGQQNNGMGGGMTGGMGGMGADQQGPESGGRENGGPGLTPAMKTTEMTIEQNHDSMGIAYPNELYRDIDWGEKEFYRETVTAGWRENILIVISSSDQMTLTETYQLNPAQDILNLTISIKDQRGTNEFLRVFNLQP